MVKLRKFQPKDLEQVLEISRISFPRPWPRKEFEKYPEFFVAEAKGKVAGFIVGKISGNIGQIKLISVAPECREKKIGGNLIEYFLEYFKQKGVKTIEARSRTKNKTGIAFFKNFGFEISKTVENYYPNGDNAYLIKKEL